jgi:hypothetical protein
MSTPLFLLASIPVGLAALGILLLAHKLLNPVFGTETALARLQRRRERRLARGEDRYFEELRSIDAAIETNSREAARPARNWFGWPQSLLLPLAVLWFGAMLLAMASVRLDLGAPPAWTARLGPAVFALIGLYHILDPAPSGFARPRTARLFGAALIAICGVLFALDTAPNPSSSLSE